MKELKLQTPSAGSAIKKIHAINPELSVTELAAIIRQCVESRGSTLDGVSGLQTINEEKAVHLAQASLRD